MDRIIPALPSGDTRSTMWLHSLAGTMAGLPLGLANLWLLWQICAPVGLALLAVPAAGLVAGALQGAWLRPYTRPPLLWLGASAAGWLLAYVVIGRPDLASGLLHLLPLTMALLIGITSSLFQWLHLRRVVRRATSWVWINAVCWCVLWFMLSALAI
jgi:hypothetical protein